MYSVGRNYVFVFISIVYQKLSKRITCTPILQCLTAHLNSLSLSFGGTCSPADTLHGRGGAAVFTTAFLRLKGWHAVGLHASTGGILCFSAWLALFCFFALGITILHSSSWTPRLLTNYWHILVSEKCLGALDFLIFLSFPSVKQFVGFYFSDRGVLLLCWLQLFCCFFGLSSCFPHNAIFVSTPIL